MATEIWNVFLIILLVGLMATATWLFLPIKAMWKNHGSRPVKAPHERWPEILHWQPGDEFDFVHYGSRAYCPVLISISEDGWAYCNDLDHKVKLPIWAMVGKNLSLNDRDNEEGLKQTQDYNELLTQFRKSYAELQERDRKNGINA